MMVGKLTPFTEYLGMLRWVASSSSLPNSISTKKTNTVLRLIPSLKKCTGSLLPTILSTGTTNFAEDKVNSLTSLLRSLPTKGQTTTNTCSEKKTDLKPKQSSTRDVREKLMIESKPKKPN